MSESKALMMKYRCRGARALVMLHERELRRFCDTWWQAKRSGLQLPKVDHPNYASLETVLRHVLQCARLYMNWICEMLELPDPRIRKTLEAAAIERSLDDHLDHVLEAWSTPLLDVPEDRLLKPEYEAPWGVKYCIEAMLEHAVMHPILHRFQLEELMGGESE